MPAQIRQDCDPSCGHCYTPRPAVTGSPNVFANHNNGCSSGNVVRVGDYYPTHCCPSVGCHDGVASQGSPNVFANGIAVHRNGDAISCGDTACNGSGNVFINGY